MLTQIFTDVYILLETLGFKLYSLSFMDNYYFNKDNAIIQSGTSIFYNNVCSPI
jgi:hypothetical protein